MPASVSVVQLRWRKPNGKRQMLRASTTTGGSASPCTTPPPPHSPPAATEAPVLRRRKLQTRSHTSPCPCKDALPSGPPGCTPFTSGRDETNQHAQAGRKPAVATHPSTTTVKRSVIVGEDGNAGHINLVATLVEARGNVIGRGAAGVVWECPAAPTVVLKQIDMSKQVGNELGSTPQFAEVQSLWHCIVARSEKHVVQLQAWALLGTTLWIVLENCDQGSLAAYVQRHGPLPTQLIRRFTRNIASAVESISTIGKVHCDIKPENIFVSKSSEGLVSLKLGDLGSAVDCNHHNTVSGNVVADGIPMAAEGVTNGTSFYQAPEAVVGRTSSHSDVFGAGASVYFMATGKAPLSPTRPERNGRSDLEVGAEWTSNTGSAYMRGGRFDRLDRALAKFRSEQDDEDLADLVETWMGFRPSERPKPLSPGFRRHSFLQPEQDPDEEISAVPPSPTTPPSSPNLVGSASPSNNLWKHALG